MKHLYYKIIIRIFFEIEIKSCLALYWRSLLMLLRLVMVCDIANFGYNEPQFTY